MSAGPSQRGAGGGEIDHSRARAGWSPAACALPVFCAVALAISCAAWGQASQAAAGAARAAAAATSAVKMPTDASLPQRIRSLRAGISDLGMTWGDRYPKAKEYLRRLQEIVARQATPDDATIVPELDRLQCEAMLANPLLLGAPIVFVTRNQYIKDHHNTATFFPAEKNEYNNGRYQGGGAIKTLDVASGKVNTLLELPQGVARDLEVDFEGKRILFSMRRDPADSYHIYEINADGGGLRQLTKLAHVDDLDPMYLPDGSIVFSSTREPKYCGCNRHIMANLFRMDGDGANIVQIGKSTLFEGHASLMPDGRILYDRWEYVDRNFGDAQALWTCNPDGTNHAIFWGNNTPSPGGILDGRIIPGTDLVVCTFSSCHDRPWGAIAIVDRSIGSDGREPVVHTWPADARNLAKNPGEANHAWDSFGRLKIKYEDPYPLCEEGSGRGAGKYFLCSRMTGDKEQTGIYLIDLFGNETLVHAEPPGCFDPMPLAPRARPGVMPDRRAPDRNEGTFYIQDVYRGTHMAGVGRGSIKYLRVIEVPEKRYWTGPTWNGQGIEGPAMNWHDFNAKQILGTAPVEADGSAYITVPAGRFVYFQLLDEDGMMVQSMRSGTMVQPGERGACVGCHDDRRWAPPSGLGVPLALRRGPSRLEGWRGPARMFNYLKEVQPIFDRLCVSCHDYEHQPKSKVVLARDRGLAFNASYAELWTKGQIKVAGAGPAEILQPYSWGSHASRIVQILKEGHYGVKLDAESLDRLITWIDLNAPYYPSYATAFPRNQFGRSPLVDAQMSRLVQLVGEKMDRAPHRISFDRPELSPCLNALKNPDPRYTEALNLIECGREELWSTPNPDVDGFVACEMDRWRESKYAQRQEIETRNRRAMSRGEKAYDPDK